MLSLSVSFCSCQNQRVGLLFSPEGAGGGLSASLRPLGEFQTIRRPRKCSRPTAQRVRWENCPPRPFRARSRRDQFSHGLGGVAALPGGVDASPSGFCCVPSFGLAMAPTTRPESVVPRPSLRHMAMMWTSRALHRLAEGLVVCGLPFWWSSRSARRRSPPCRAASVAG